MKNVVFDLGNVIIKFDPDYMLSPYKLSEEDREVFMNEIFRSPLWQDCDRGCGFRDTVLAPALDKLPRRLHKIFYELICRHDLLSACFPETPGIKKLIEELKDNGYKIYLLSNVGLDFHIYYKHSDILSLFDGVFPSCDYGLLKPEKEIFETFLSRFSLKASECIFIDDSPANVNAGKAAGMSAVRFNALAEPVEELRRKLISENINISL